MSGSGSGDDSNATGLMPLYQYSLKNGYCVSTSRTVYTCTLDTEDLNEIKRLPFCTRESDCCVIFTGDAIKDYSRNIIETEFGDCGVNSSYIFDTNRPQLVQFTEFNLHNSTLTLLFNETIDASTFNMSAITLQSFYYNAHYSYTLTGGIILTQDSTVAQLKLLQYDLHEIQRLRALCSELNNCWIVFSSYFVDDMAGNSIIPVPDTNAKPAVNFIDDMRPPRLVAFELDLSNDTLTLTFSEIVDAESLEPTAISILSESSEDAITITLTGGSTVSPDGLSIVIDLLAVDTNRLRALDDIATNENNTFISIDSSLITDAVRLEANQVEAIDKPNALKVSPDGLYEDYVPPRLTQFSLDLDQDIITLTFNEPVRVSSILYNYITLISDQNNSPVDHRTLVGGVIDPSTNFNGTMMLIIHLTQPDIRYLKLSEMDLANSIYDTYISVLEGMILDMSDNPLVPLPYTSALRARSFTPDTTPAVLVDFQLDMDLGLLHLTFNDIINSSTLYAPAITIQDTRFIMSNFVTLTKGSTTSSPNGYYITINISVSDLNRIKFNDNLATSIDNTYLSMRAESFMDNFGVDVIAITSHDAIKAFRFINDTTPPELLDFTLDMNIGIIHLTFDETVRANTIIEEEIILLGNFNISTTSSVQLNGGISSSTDSTFIDVYIMTTDLNDIKFFTDLGTSINDTFIAFSEDLIMDMNTNPVAPIDQYDAKQATLFIQDLRFPRLLSFSINLTENTLTLVFDETVHGATLQANGLTVQNSRVLNTGSYRTLQSSSGSLVNSTITTVYLGLSDLNEIKRITNLATSVNDTYISATNLTIKDMNGNSLTVVPNNNAIKATGYYGDTIRPSLEGFSLNLSSEILTLSFSETVRARTHHLSLYTLLSSNDTEAVEYSLTGGISNIDDYHILDIELTTSDLNEIKRLIELATEDDDTFLSVEADAIEDMFTNPLLPSDEPLPVTVYVPDLIRPELNSFHINMNTGELTLFFSETVNTSTFVVEQMQLQNNITQYFRFTESSYINSSFYHIVTVYISPDDLNEIKRLDQLALDNTTTFLTITSKLVYDMNGNSIVTIHHTNPLPTSVYIRDLNPPQLVSFDLDIDSSLLVLQFNETVESSSLNVTAITLQSNESFHLSEHTLSLTDSSYTISPDGTSIIINISTADLNELKRLNQLATSDNDTYLSLTSDAISDMSGNSIVPILSSASIPVSLYTPDDTSPTLDRFSLDMNTGILRLTFSETVNALTLNISDITLQSRHNDAGVSYSLTDGLLPDQSYSNSTDSTVLTVYIGVDDLNEIKRLYRLATTPDNTYLSVASSLIEDMNELSVVPISSTNALPVGNYTDDTSTPVLLSASLNLTSETLSLTFDETVNVDSFNVTQITIQSTRNISEGSFVDLNHYRSLSVENSTVITLVFAFEDLNDIKLNTYLATNQSNAWIRIYPLALLDMAYEANPIQDTIQLIANFTEDHTDPVLTSFSVDLNTGILILNFDEPVDVSTLNYTAFTLYSTPLVDDVLSNTSLYSNDTLYSTNASDASIDSDDRPFTYYTLTDGSTNSVNGLQVILNLTIDDLNAIKKDEYLYFNRNSSHLSITAYAIDDMNSNPISSITPSMAVQAFQYISDRTSPVLISFDLDMNTGLLVLHFPETIDVSTTRFDGIVLQQSSNVTLSIKEYMLTSGYLNMTDDGVTAYIQITHYDLNEIKQRRIGLSNTTTWLTIEESTLLDMSDQPLLPLVNGHSAKRVDDYKPDVTSPYLVSFILDLDNDQLLLSFSETVDGYNLNVSTITLQDTANASYLYNHYTLTSESSSVSYAYGPNVTVSIGTSDINIIKELIELAISLDTTYISITEELVDDVFDNAVISIDSTEAQQATDFIHDANQPNLTHYEIDMNDKILTLYFSETVNGSSLNIDSFTLLAEQATSDFTIENYTLQTSYTLTGYSSVINIRISDDDFNRIKQLTGLATDIDTTYLSVTSDGILDTSDNQVISITPDEAIKASEYIKDATNPTLTGFDLDMNYMILTLTFSETVNVSSIEYTALSLIDSDVEDPIEYTLLSGETDSVNAPVIVIDITKEDEDNLKRIADLATTENNTYISITSLLIQDMDDLPVNNITFVMALRVRNFTRDTTRPALVSFNLNLTSDLLTLTFSETVNASTLYISGITLQNEESLDLNTTVYHTLTDSSWVIYDDPVIYIDLSFYDRNELKRLYTLATSVNDTYITISSGSVLDMVDLPLVPVLNISAELVNTHTEDNTPPYLSSFTLNMSSEILTLNFSETVNINTFDATQLTLVGVPANSSYQLTGGVVLNRDHTYLVDLLLTDPDLNEIKFDINLATVISNTHVTFTSYLVSDMNQNPVIPVISPVMAIGFRNDTVPPVLNSFDLDLDEGTLSLHLSETVNADSLIASELTLLAYPNATNDSFIFSPSSVTYSINGTTLVINISQVDLDDIKRLSMLAIDNTSTYLSLTNDALSDMNANPIELVSRASPALVQSYTPDTTDPELLEFSVNFTSEVITLSFSETVNVSSISISSITIQSSNSSDALSVNLRGGEVITMTNDPVVVIKLSQDDLNLIKSLTDLATSMDNTFISATDQLVSDMAGNSFEEILNTSSLGVSNFYDDTIRPELNSFDLDMNAGTITLYFSESVSSSSLTAQSMTFLNTDQFTNSTVSYTLVNDTSQPLVILNDSVVIVFTLSDEDRYRLQELVTLATSLNDTFLSFDSDLVLDQFENYIIPNIIPVGSYKRDTTCPKLYESVFNLDESTLLLTFSEPVNASTFDETQLTVYSTLSFSSISHTLTMAIIEGSDVYTRFLNLRLSDFDTDTIKSIPELGSSLINTYVYLTNYSIRDTSDNQYCPDTLPLIVSDFIDDAVSPVLLNFTFDLNLATIYLTFSESVQYAALDVNEIMLLSAPNSFTDYTLTGGSTSVNATYPHVVILSLTHNDTNEIKHITSLATELNNTYISITNYTVSDYSNNPVEMIDIDEALPARMFIQDMTPPSLIEFDLDMDRGVLLLSFTEVINISSIDLRQITIQNQQSLGAGASSHVVQDGLVSFQNLTRVLIKLSPDDLNAIKKIPELAGNMSTTYLSFTTDLLTDNARLPVVPISSASAEPVSGYTIDTTPPILNSFSLNLTSEILSLTFDETVESTSVIIPGIIIQDDYEPTASVKLTTGEVPDDDSTVINIQLDIMDLHNIKRQLDLATDDNNTCITILSDSITDMSTNMNKITETTQCTTDFTPDLIRPRLISFGANVNRSELYLNFDEPMDLSSINLTFVTLQSVQNVSSSSGSYESYTLTGGNVSSTSLLQFTVTITNDDLNEIKRLLNLLRSPFSSYISITKDLGVDLNGNPVVPITSDNSLDTSMFSDDANRPNLENFDFDLNTGLLTLSFSETVLVSSFDITGLTLQLDSAVYRSEQEYTLTNTGTLLNTDNGPVVSYIISNTDLNALKTRGIGRYSTTTYLSMTNNTVHDIIGQYVIPLISGVHVLMVNGYSPDINPPKLESFQLDMNTAILTLSFNESIDVSSLNVEGLTLAATSNETSDQYVFTLTPKSVSSSLNVSEIEIVIHNDDLNEIKKRPALATNINNTYIYIAGDTILDMFGNPNVEFAPVEAIRASDFTADTTDPSLTGFDLDMDTGVLSLSFTETVNTSSLNTAGITFYSEESSGASESFTLSGNYVTINDYDPVLVVQLTNDDLNEIKILEMLATMDNNTFLRIVPSAIVDMNNNPVSTSDIVPVTDYTIDITPPLLNLFVIDMDLGQLVLNFSESVRFESVLFDYLAVRANETLPSIPANVDRQHQLTDGTVLTLSGPSLRLQITEMDLNEIKRKDVCTIDLKEQDCYLAYRTGGIQDMANNPIQGCREL